MAGVLGLSQTSSLPHNQQYNLKFHNHSTLSFRVIPVPIYHFEALLSERLSKMIINRAGRLIFLPTFNHIIFLTQTFTEMFVNIRLVVFGVPRRFHRNPRCFPRIPRFAYLMQGGPAVSDRWFRLSVGWRRAAH